MRKNIISLFILYLANVTIASAQSKLLFKHYRYDTGIAFRWYPADRGSWINLSHNKIQVQRINLTEDPKKQHPVTLFPNGIGLDSQQFTTGFIAANPAAEIILECLKNKSLYSPVETVKADDECMLYSMLLLQSDFKLTLHFGLGFLDMTADPQSTYLYRFMSSLNKDTIDFFVPISNGNTPIEAPNLIENENSIICKIIRNNMPEYCAGIIIEKSSDSGQTWSTITSKPIIKDVFISDLYSDIFFTDEQKIENKPLFYRLKPINYFGDTLIPGETSTIFIGQKDQEYPKNISVTHNCIQWDFPEEINPRIYGFGLCFAEYPDDQPTAIDSQILDPNIHSFCLSPMAKSGYYFVASMYKTGTITFSSPILYQSLDSLPPDPVNVISSHIDSLGRISIAWNQSLSNDRKGYQVYRSNFRIAEYSNLSIKWQEDTLFFDTINIGWLRDSVYYYIVCADERYNESSPSKVVALAIPDTSKPDFPIIIGHYLREDSVLIYGYGSSTKNIEQYELYRSENDGAFLFCTSIVNCNDSFCVRDPFSALGRNYTYKIRVKSSNKKYSDFSPPYTLQTQESLLLPPVKGLQTWIDTVAQKLYVQWQKPEYQVSHFRILNNKNGTMETISTQNGDTFELVMPLTHFNKPMQWKIIAYDNQGRRSAW